MSERTIWIAAGLLGLAVAVGLAVLTSHVSQPPVGVPGEPVSAGKALAPARTATVSRARPDGSPTRTTATTATVTAPSRPAVPAQPPRDDDDESSGSGSGDQDSSGRGRGRGRGRGGDD